ncbi:hypothetical protein AAFF_G00348920 [Aldrovandia affinis]|uniref:Transposase n=1 Tax=Aldrovandia affinis TaxID=143900 RepID=A0AAD7SLD2_9TELE|nr:hypothetical protein AAFF_G00348920 [Aldrovandia affinis]
MFNIERKVQATVTDNGSNFVKAFREFGQREEVEEGSQDDNEDAARFEDVAAILEGEVIDTVVKAIDSRFQKLFSSREAKLATASSPQFRLWWLPDEEKEDVRRMLVAEASNMEPAENTAAAAKLRDSGEEDFFSYGPAATRGTNSGPPEEVRKYLEGTNKKLGALEDFPTIKQVFIKYNTTLPSSAAVEHLFSHGGNLFTPQCNRMTDEHFEQVLLLRYNSKICTVAVE